MKADIAVQTFKASELFGDLSEAELRELEQSTRLVMLRRGEALYLEGDPRSSLHQLGSGRIKLSRISVDGKEFILDLVAPGEIFGEMTLLDDEPRDTMAVALEDSQVLAIPVAKLEALLQRRPELAWKVAKLIGRHRKRFESRVASLLFKKVQSRLAGLLLELGEEYGTRDSRGMLLQIQLNQQELGNLIGASREIVNQTLSDFRRRGFIGQEGRQLIIRHHQPLQQL